MLESSIALSPSVAIQIAGCTEEHVGLLLCFRRDFFRLGSRFIRPVLVTAGLGDGFGKSRLAMVVSPRVLRHTFVQSRDQQRKGRCSSRLVAALGHLPGQTVFGSNSS